MAKFIDERENEELEDDEELSNFEDSEDSDNEETEEDSTEEEVVSGKYNGKSIQDIIAMHQNAEQLLGRQGQEVGELRKIVDDFIQTQTVKQNAHNGSADTEDDDLDFFENPKKSIQKMLDEHPALKESKQLSSEMKKSETLARIKATHPDYMEVIKDSKFGEWVQKSKIRQQLLLMADQQYNFDAADELLNLWKDRRGVINSSVESEKRARKQAVKTASSGTSRGSGERPSRKIYRRADIIDLMRKDPDRYESLMPEIRKAYAEGRVKS